MTRSALLALVFLSASCSRRVPAGNAEPVPPAPTALATPSSEAPALAAPTDPPGTYLGRTVAAPMSWRGADWLDRADRDASQRPEHVLDVLAVKEGQTVVDVGCGSGYFTVHLSRRVGPKGRVLATDLQQEMLDLLAKRTAKERLANVTPILATASDAKLPRGAVDLVLMVDVYHEVADPPRTLTQIKSALAPGGRLALVEYRGEDPKVAIKPEHKTTLVQLDRELGANGFRRLASDESLPEQRIVTYAPL